MADGSLTGCTVLVPAARFDLPAGTPPVPLEVGEFVPGGRRHEAYYKTTSLALKEYLQEGKTEYAHKLDWSAEDLLLFERTRARRRAAPPEIYDIGTTSRTTRRTSAGDDELSRLRVLLADRDAEIERLERALARERLVAMDDDELGEQRAHFFLSMLDSKKRKVNNMSRSEIRAAAVAEVHDILLEYPDEPALHKPYDEVIEVLVRNPMIVGMLNSTMTGIGRRMYAILGKQLGKKSATSSKSTIKLEVHAALLKDVMEPFLYVAGFEKKGGLISTTEPSVVKRVWSRRMSPTYSDSLYRAFLDEPLTPAMVDKVLARYSQTEVESAKAQILDSFCAGSYVKMATAISLLTISKYNGGGQARAAEVAAEAWVKVGEGTPFVFEHKPNLHGTIDLFVTFYRQRRERRHDGSGRYRAGNASLVGT